MIIDKFINVKDPHFRFGFNEPIGRTDNFFNEIDDKIDQVVDIAKKNQIKIVTFTGDVFDIKTPSRYSLPIINQIKQRLKKFKDADIEIIAIDGNHDLPFSSRDMKNQGIYYSMCEDGYITDVSDKTITRGTFNFSGIGYNSPEKLVFNKLDKLNDRLKNTVDGQFNVVILHQHFVPNTENLEYVSFFKYHQLLKYDNIDIFALGHLHKGFKTIYQENNNKHVQFLLNGWNLTRLARDYYVVNENHKPQINLVSVVNGQIEVEDIYLKINDFDKAFIKKDLENENKVIMNLSKFINQLKTISNLDEHQIDYSKFDINSRIKQKIEQYLSN